jgi:hypothetical protein
MRVKNDLLRVAIEEKKINAFVGGGKFEFVITNGGEIYTRINGKKRTVAGLKEIETRLLTGALKAYMGP